MIFKPFMREHFMPLPVAFISTISRTGIRNIAPYGCVMPVLRPLDLICVASAKKRDTLVNINETGEFVVNLVSTQLADKVMPAARFTPPEIDEFVDAGISAKPSENINSPGLADAYAWMECKLDKTFEEPDYVLIMGRVVHLEVADAVLTSDGVLNIEKARPLMMTGGDKGMNFCTVTGIDQFEPFSAMFPNGRDPLDQKYRR